MSNTNVKIKLSADGQQVKNELKLIDKEIKELGGDTKTSSKSSKSNARDKNKDNETSQNQQTAGNTQHRDSKEVAKQETRDKVNDRLTRELTLIRKELQKINGANGKGQNSSGGQQTTTSSEGSGSNSTPSTSSESDSEDNRKSNKLSDVIGKLATAAVALKVASSAWNSLSASAKSAASGESTAYRIYGSTLAYDDYNTARKDASNMGSPYGYDYETVMNAGDANMSKAGFKDIDSYNDDLNSILAASKGWGIDASALASTSGYMSSIGVTEIGDQSKFTNLLSQSIVDAQMTGREDEQLQVLEQIAESLAQVNTTVSEKNITDQLNMYNALVDQNENLKGTRGVSLINNMQDLATSGDTSLDILAGLNTEFTGKEGYIELRKMAEENPMEYWQRVVSGARQYGYEDTDIQYKLLKSSGLSTSQIKDLLSGVYNVENFSVDDTKDGEDALKERTKNYQDSDVFTQEQHEVEKKEKSDDRGNTVNSVLNPFKKIYNGLPDWAQQGVDGLGFTAKAALAIGGTKLVSKGVTSGVSALKKRIFGGAGTDAINPEAGTNSAVNSVDDAASALANSTDDAIGAVDDTLISAANSLDDVAGATDDVASSLANSADDALRGVSGLSKAAKSLGIVGLALQAGKGIYDFTQADSTKEKSEVVGSTSGSMAGASSGAGAGAAIGTAIFPGVGTAIGGIAGAIAGSIGGDWAGTQLGESLGQDLEDAEKNYGNKWAGLPIIGGLWRKDGTLSQQEIKKENTSASVSGGLPSEFGLPATLNNYLKDNGDINWRGMESGLSSENDTYRKQMEKKYGLTYEELQNWKNSDEYAEYQKSHGWIKEVDSDSSNKSEVNSRSTKKSEMIGTTVENTPSIKDSKISEKGAEFTGKESYIGLSKMTEENSENPMEYWKTIIEKSQKQLSSKSDVEYKLLKSSGMSTSQIENLLPSEFINKNSSNKNSNESKDEVVSDNISALEENTEALKKLYGEGGSTFESPYLNGYVNSTLSSGSEFKTTESATSKTTINPLSNNKTSGSFWSMWRNILKYKATSHATGNDYVPYDDYLANLHKGEMVLTKFEADEYRQGKTNNNTVTSNSYSTNSQSIDLNINIGGSVDGLTLENQTKLIEVVRQQISSVGMQNLISNSFQRVQNC